MVIKGPRARWVGEKNFWGGWVVRQRIRLPCTTSSTPLDFNLGADDRRAEGNSFTFQ